MSIFFTMIGGRAAFFDSDLHGDAIPADAVKITPVKHAQLMDGQADGQDITTDSNGKPKLANRLVTDADRRGSLVAAIKREAARRIEAVSPIWRQINDARAPSDDGAARFARIDAIRQAGELIEQQLVEAPANVLDRFEVRDNPLWPEIN